MSGGQVVGSIVVLAALVYGGFSLHQALTGELRAVRKPKVRPTVDRIKQGGLVATVGSAIVLMYGLGAAIGGSAGQAIWLAGGVVFILVCMASMLVGPRRVGRPTFRRRR
jgi:hypothetical protein